MITFIEIIKYKMPLGSDLIVLITNDFLENNQSMTFGDLIKVTRILQDFDVETPISFSSTFDDSIQITLDGDKLKRQAEGFQLASDDLFALEQIAELYAVSVYFDHTIVYELSGEDLVIVDEWKPKGDDLVCTE